jgi:hypothetical protein
MLGTETYGVGGSVSAGSVSFTWSKEQNRHRVAMF